jgi:hypothetical protein
MTGAMSDAAPCFSLLWISRGAEPSSRHVLNVYLAEKEARSQFSDGVYGAGGRGQDTNCRISRPTVGAGLCRSEPPPSTALSVEVAWRRRRGGRLSRWRMRRRARPEAPSGKLSPNIIPGAAQSETPVPLKMAFEIFAWRGRMSRPGAVSAELPQNASPVRPRKWAAIQPLQRLFAM